MKFLTIVVSMALLLCLVANYGTSTKRIEEVSELPKIDEYPVSMATIGTGGNAVTHASNLYAAGYMVATYRLHNGECKTEVTKIDDGQLREYPKLRSARLELESDNK